MVPVGRARAESSTTQGEKMRIIHAVGLSLGLLALSGCSGPEEAVEEESTPEEVATAYSPIPAGYDWPADPAVLDSAVARGDRAAVRDHAWRLWAGINQPISETYRLPVWWTWPTTTQLFETGRAEARVLADRRRPRPSFAAASHQPCIAEICLPGPKYPVPSATVSRFDLPGGTIKDGRHFQNNGDIMVATESYSREAARAIGRLGYDRGAVYDSLLHDSVAVIPGLPREHVVTKHMYWPVKADTLTPLPVFDGVPEARWHVYNGYETWNRFVAVDPRGGPEGRTVELQFLFNVLDSARRSIPTSTVEASTVSIDSFYHQRVDSTFWSQLDDYDRAMLDAASRWATDQPFEIGDFVVTVAMHINTKEISSWTLQSVWWHDRPDEGPYAANRPDIPDARGPWRHYLITTAYGIPEDDGNLPMAYNPYIELAATHPVATNCRNCHMRAAWPRNRAWYLQDPGPGPLADIHMSDSIFEGALLLDFQWVFSDRVRD